MRTAEREVGLMPAWIVRRGATLYSITRASLAYRNRFWIRGARRRSRGPERIAVGWSGCRTGESARSCVRREHLHVGADAVGHLEALREFGVADHDEPVGKQGLLPVAAVGADGQELLVDEPRPEVAADRVEAVDAADDPLALRPLADV